MEEMNNNVNELVGLLGTKRELWQEIHGEKYYLSTIEIEGYSIPIVMSTFFFDAYAGTRVRVSVMPRITRVRKDGDRLVYTYLYCVLAESVGDDVPDCRYVRIQGQVASKRSKLELCSGVVNKVHFELRYAVRFRQSVILLVPCQAYGKVARSLCGLHKGQNMILEGYITGNSQSMKLRIRKVLECNEVDPLLVNS